MVELNDALGDIERMMIWNRNDSGAEADALGAHRGADQEHLGRPDCFPSCGMTLPDPEFVVLQVVEPFGQFQVALQLQGRMLADWMMGCEKDPEAETMIHCVTP